MNPATDAIGMTIGLIVMFSVCVFLWRRFDEGQRKGNADPLFLVGAFVTGCVALMNAIVLIVYMIFCIWKK